MTDLAKLTWPEARDLFSERTVGLVPVGTTEPHGPHLPLDTDVTIATAQARRAAERLEELGVRTVVVPTVPYGVTHFTDGFTGWLSLRPGTLWALLEDLFESLEQQGLRRIVMVNAHLEPGHIKVLRNVIKDRAEIRKRSAQVVFADNTSRRFAGDFGDEFQSGECHAGRYESSIVLAADGAAVREDERLGLPPKTIGLIEKMRSGVLSFREAGADQAYCGAPAEASAAEGASLVDRLADMAVTVARETWPELF